VEAAIRAEHRRLFWASFRQAATSVAKNPVAAAAEAADRELFEGTLADGLEAESIPD
jgi:hypothetical protein